MPSIRLPSASYNQPSRSPSRLVNCYAQAKTDKGPFEVIGAPGVAPFASLGAGPGRGLFVMRGTLYAVSGTTLYRIDEFGAEAALGTLPGSTKLTFAGNGTEIVFSNKYIYSAGSVSAITDPDMPAVSAIDYVDGYVVYAESGSGRWGCSQLYDGATYDGLDFATAEAYPDDLVTLKVDHRQVLLFGQESTEIWWNSGNAGAGFAFERLAGGFLEYGCLARLGVAKQDNSVFWLANDRTIRRLTSQTPVRVSQHGVEEALASYARVDDCEAFPYTWNGHLFAVFKFPTAGATWVLDVTTGEWHERETYGSSTWNIVDAVHCYGKVFVQSSTTGAVGELSDTTYTEFGGILRREVTFPTIYQGSQRLYHNQLDLMLRTGDAPVGVTPTIQMDLSDDGGNTWASLAARSLSPLSVGQVGDYRRVVRFTRLGMARDRVYRTAVSDAVPFHLLDSQLTVAAGSR
jgi:hypothetical protein